MTASAGPLEIILGDVEKALHAGLWYAALAVTLSLPDICSLLELPPEEGWSKRHKFAGWYNRNVARYTPNFTGDDCYRLRGGVLHHGKFGHGDQRYDHIVFTTPASMMRMHCFVAANNSGVEESVLSMDVEYFCRDVARAVRGWFAANETNLNVIANLPRVVAIRSGAVGSQIHAPNLLR